MKISCESYTENGCQPIPKVRLSDEEDGRALQRFIPACADVVPIDRKRRLIYLTKRIAKPMQGWWWIGGGIPAGMTKEKGTVANFRRETGLELPLERLRLMAVNDYRWMDRAQEPSDIGCHMLGYTFVVALTAEERSAIVLDPVEYQVGSELHSFDRDQLVAENVHPAILHLYDDLFPS